MGVVISCSCWCFFHSLVIFRIFFFIFTMSGGYLLNVINSIRAMTWLISWTFCYCKHEASGIAGLNKNTTGFRLFLHICSMSATHKKLVTYNGWFTTKRLWTWSIISIRNIFFFIPLVHHIDKAIKSDNLNSGE